MRFRWNETLGRLETLSGASAPAGRIHLWTDKQYESLTPVVEHDGADERGRAKYRRVDISSRSKHREFMRSRGYALMDDFKETWKAAEKERAAAALGEHDKKAVHEAVERAYYDVFESPGRQERPRRLEAELNGEPSPVVREYLPHRK